MAAIAPALLTLLTANSALTALVGKRITPLEADRSEVFPLVVYELRDFERPGGLGGANGIANCVFRATAIAKSYADMDAVGTAIADVLAWYQGTVNGVVFQGIFLDKTEENRIVDPDTDATLYFLRTLDFDLRASA